MSAPLPPPAGDPRPAPRRSYRIAQRIEAPLTNLLGLTCREFARLAVTRLDRPLTRGETLRHWMHGSLCGICSRFEAQFALLHDLTREIETEPAPDNSADAAALTRITTAVRAATQQEPDK